MLLAAAPALAQDSEEDSPDLSPEHSSCMDESGGVTFRYAGLRGGEAGDAGPGMQSDYDALIGCLPEDKAEALKKARRAWIVDRDATCLFAELYEERHHRLAERLQFRARFTLQRRVWLEGFLE